MTRLAFVVGLTLAIASAIPPIARAQTGTGWDNRFAPVGMGGLGMGANVLAVAVLGNDVYAGGDFTAPGGVSASHIARWDGTAWSAVGSGTDGRVSALAVIGTDLYAAGTFTTAGGVPASNIAKWDGSTWSAVGSGTDGTVLALAASGTDLYAGGVFTTAGGVGATGIAKWDGSTWSALGTGIAGEVWCLATNGADVYAGGDFATAGGIGADHIAKWDGATWSPLGTGIDRRVFGLAVLGSTLYAGGEFHTAGGVSTQFVARWNGTSWAAMGGGADGDVHTVLAVGNVLYVGGDFATMDGLTVNDIARWDGTTWSALASGLGHVPGSPENAPLGLVVLNDALHVGGALLMADGNPSEKFAIWHGICGDAFAELGEECDDGNATSGDGCEPNCTTNCGNGVLNGSEVCDDGNPIDGDGCDHNCTVTACGNGIVTSGEACDDGNLVDGDGCDGNCTVTACGNGIVTSGEACDDGNPVDDDGCDSNCTVTACGNGIVTSGEACDDGNPVDGDGCDVDCTRRGCGNGVIAGDEGCDDGNLVDGDGCDGNCTATACGNGILTSGEACDDGDVTNGDGCDGNCTITGCGNGVVTAGEACDDGNALTADGCEPNCATSQVSEMASAGDTVTTDPGNMGATPTIPVQTAITTPNPGVISIVSSNQPLLDVHLGHLLGTQFGIEGPFGSPGVPLKVFLTVDASLLPGVIDVDRLSLARDGVAAERCTGPANVASPDPCLESVVVLSPSGDVKFTALTSHLSLWGAVLRPLPAAQQRCVNGMIKAGMKVAKAQAKLDVACLKNAAKGTELDAQACLSADLAGKVAAAQAKATHVAAILCADVPSFGYAGPGPVNAAAVDESIGLVADVFGADLQSSTLPSSNQIGASCQAKVLAAAQSLLGFEANVFAKCQKAGLAGKSNVVVASEDLGVCIDALLADADGKIAKAAGKLSAALEPCVPVAGAAFPGRCASGDVSCLTDRIECRLCLMLNAMEDLAENCDLFDDGNANLSCP